MSEQIEIKVPDIGDFDDVPVIEVLAKAGDHVEKEQSLVTLESDKATMEVPSPAAGVILEMQVGLGDSVAEGHVIAVLETVEAEVADEPAPPEESMQQAAAVVEAPPAAKPEPAPPPAAKPADAGPRQSPPVPMNAASVAPGKVPHASPAMRAFARELGVDLMRVTGTGRKQRIQRQDVTAYVKSTLNSAAPAAAAPGSAFPFRIAEPPNVDFGKFGETERQPLSRIQKIAGANLHRNWIGIPHVTQHDIADITDMEAFRKANAQDAIDQGFKLTPLVFLIKASVASLKKFPQFNASLDADGEHLVMKRYFHIGIAVDTPNGLVVPVLRDCERKGIMELAAELGEISGRAREGKLKPTEMQGGCFTISSLGGIGGTAFTPIINAPEVAILGVSRSRLQPVWDGQQFLPRLMLPLSLSYDHRVIDGAMAARFARHLGERLEDLRRLTL